MNRCQQEVRSVGPDHESIHGMQSFIGQFKVIDQHDHGYVRPGLLDLIGDRHAIQQAQVVFEDNGVHRPRYQEPQSIRTIGCGRQFVSVLLQVAKLSGIPVNAQ